MAENSIVLCPNLDPNEPCVPYCRAASNTRRKIEEMRKQGKQVTEKDIRSQHQQSMKDENCGRQGIKSQ